MRQGTAEAMSAPPDPAAGARGSLAHARPARAAPRVDTTSLARALQSRANVLVKGDAGAARDLFESACREGPLHVLSAEDLNSEGMCVLSRAAGPQGGWVLLEGIEALETWAQVALLDALESPAEVGSLVGIPRVISTSREDLAALVAIGRFSLPLYLRLSTIRMELPGAAPRAPSGRPAPGRVRR
jgi:transcriptional regulator of aromatic amino acid metabolism